MFPDKVYKMKFLEITLWHNNMGRSVYVYLEPRDWWVGYYRGDTYHYVCVLPTLVIRWSRKK